MDKGYVQSLVDYLNCSKKKDTKLAVYETKDNKLYIVYVIDDEDKTTHIAKALSLDYRSKNKYESLGACVMSKVGSESLALRLIKINDKFVGVGVGGNLYNYTEMLLSNHDTKHIVGVFQPLPVLGETMVQSEARARKFYRKQGFEMNPVGYYTDKTTQSVIDAVDIAFPCTTADPEQIILYKKYLPKSLKERGIVQLNNGILLPKTLERRYREVLER